MRKRIRIFPAALAALLLLCACAAGGQPAPAAEPSHGEVLISFDFARQSGHASNQFAVWIADMDGNLIKTLYATRFTAKGGYERRPDSIPSWVAAAGPASMQEAEIDALTGATPKSGALSYAWDLRDEAGEPVPPGAYRFFVEGSLRWKNRVLYEGVIETGGGESSVSAEAAYAYEAAEGQDALDGDSPENAMLGAVTARFTPAPEC